MLLNILNKFLQIWMACMYVFGFYFPEGIRNVLVGIYGGGKKKEDLVRLFLPSPFNWRTLQTSQTPLQRWGVQNSDVRQPHVPENQHRDHQLQLNGPALRAKLAHVQVPLQSGQFDIAVGNKLNNVAETGTCSDFTLVRSVVLTFVQSGKLGVCLFSSF